MTNAELAQLVKDKWPGAPYPCEDYFIRGYRMASDTLTAELERMKGENEQLKNGPGMGAAVTVMKLQKENAQLKGENERLKRLADEEHKQITVCPNCHGRGDLHMFPLKVTIRGEEITVDDVIEYRCNDKECGVAWMPWSSEQRVYAEIAKLKPAEGE